MAWLNFNRVTGKIELYAGKAPNHCAASYPNSLGTWPAHNQATTTSNGPWPPGVYKWSHYNTHAEAGMMPACHNTAYGCFGIHVFSVPNRPGIGVHAGRTQGQINVIGGKTLGCIRIPPNAMQVVNQTHNEDKITAILAY